MILFQNIELVFAFSNFFVSLTIHELSALWLNTCLLVFLLVRLCFHYGSNHPSTTRKSIFEAFLAVEINYLLTNVWNAIKSINFSISEHYPNLLLFFKKRKTFRSYNIRYIYLYNNKILYLDTSQDLSLQHLSLISSYLIHFTLE